ncbi:hypothetical protein EZV62_010434 [Acer yangbiense]|uniref:RING-type E3 ubiquitin transferase n=1 Tax=Acer yangbiense TaxID=1000413 RepID=A0A5C7I2M8_9ROSI|nr:hypothetical protein EZV62_010434 [Acer yangbiense]
MKFFKKYQEYMQQRQEKKLAGVNFKGMKKILKKCGREFQSQQKHVDGDVQARPYRCTECGETFFASLLDEMSGVVGCFNERAQQLLEHHLASGLGRCLVWLKDKLKKGTPVTLFQEANDLVTYAIINAIALRKILEKYDKVLIIYFIFLYIFIFKNKLLFEFIFWFWRRLQILQSKEGQAFKSKAQSMHIDILQSPWLLEVLALLINLRETGQVNSSSNCAFELFEGCSLTFIDGKPSLSYHLFDSINIDIDLSCPICLDTVFDPVSLKCSHILCYMCATSAASVSIVDGLKAADSRKRCPLCREAGVYQGAIHLKELSILLSRSCREYWEERLRTERAERVRQAKEHWESQCRAFMGV